MFLQEGVDTTNPESMAAAVSSKSSTQYADAARSILVAISANRSTQVSGAVGANVLAAYSQNNTQVAHTAHASSLHPKRQHTSALNPCRTSMHPCSDSLSTAVCTVVLDKCTCVRHHTL